MRRPFDRGSGLEAPATGAVEEAIGMCAARFASAVLAGLTARVSQAALLGTRSRHMFAHVA